MEDMNPSSRWLTPVAAVILAIPFGASLPAFAQSAAQAPAQPNASAAAPGSGAPTHAPQNFAGPVKIAMRNVDFHLTDRIVVHMVSVDGKLTPVKDFPVFDDKL